MKFPIILFYMLSSYNLLFCQYSQNNFVNHDRVKNKVQYCVEHQYETIKKNDKLFKSTYFGKVIYKYDRKGNLIEESNFGRNKDKNKWHYWLSYKNVFEYNEKNLLVKKTDFHADGSQNIIFYSYNDDNILIEENSVNPQTGQKSDNSFYYKYEWNDDKKPIIKYIYNSDSNLINYVKIQYNEFGEISEEVFLEFNKLNSPDTLEIRSYIYFKQQKLSKMIRTDVRFKTRETEIYDIKGNKIESIEEWFDLKKTRVTKLHYEYNEKGNWIKQYISPSDNYIYTYLNQREYTYY